MAKPADRSQVYRTLSQVYRARVYRALGIALFTVLFATSCGLESTISLCPLPEAEDSNIDEDGIGIRFDHLLCGESNPPVAQIDSFRGYDIYYRIYGDTEEQQSRLDADVEAIQDPERQATTTLNARNYRRLESFFTDNSRAGRPTIDLSGNDALRTGPVEVTIDFSEIDGDEATAQWEAANGSGDERILRRNIDADDTSFSSDSDDYSSGDPDVDNQVENGSRLQIVLFAVSLGRAPEELAQITSFEARLLTVPGGLEFTN